MTCSTSCCKCWTTDASRTGQGSDVDFRNTIIIMTSNIGSPVIQEFYGGDRASVKDEAELERVVKLELKAHFRPEFLIRVDDIIIFHNLDENTWRASWIFNCNAWRSV